MIPIRKVGGRVHWAEYNPAIPGLETLCGRRVRYAHREGQAVTLISYYRFADPGAEADCGHCLHISGREGKRPADGQ